MLIQGHLRCFGAVKYVAKHALFVLFFVAKIFTCAIIYAFSISGLMEPFHISQHQYFTHSSHTTVAVHSIVSQCVEVQRGKKRDFDQYHASIVVFPIPIFMYLIFQ